MSYKPLVVLLLCGAACAAQSALTIPFTPDQASEQTNPDSTMAQRSSGPRGVATGPTKSPNLSPQPEGGAEFTPPLMPSAKVVGPVMAKSEFQRFAEDAAGHPLEVYGRALFEQTPTTFAPADNIPVPSDYVIGPGDELILRIWGKINLDARFTVDRNGQILVPRVATLSVAGLHYGELESYIRSAVSDFYRDFEINVTLGRLRSIQIYVLGNARQPGTYTISSLSTLVNALFVSGGPSATGSMRNIELRRGNQIASRFDVYELLRNGDKSHDISLLPGDVLYIPPVGPQVVVLGSVNEPGIYELKNPSNVDSALQVAGGLTALASDERILIEHVEDHKRRRVDEFALDANGLRCAVHDGDLVRVFPLSPQFDNSVTLRGNVALPGRYPWHEGMRVSNLIPTRESLITRDYWNQQNHLLQPENPNPFSASADSRFPEEIMYQAQLDRSNGLGRNTIALPAVAPDPPETTNSEIVEQDTKVLASIAKNSAEINWDYAVIERLDAIDLSTHLIPFRLAAAIDDHASPDNQVLQPGDVVTVFARADLELPMEKHAAFVRVGGEVNAPGVYRVNPGDTLQDVVQRAGGLTSHSYLYASKFTRLSALRAEEEQQRKSSEEMQRELISRYASAGATTGQTATDQQAQLAMQQSAIARLFAIKPTGRVVLQMRPTATQVDDIPAIPLEDGDTFYVPPKLSTVQVAGSVYNPSAFRYQAGKTVRSYLNDAGGPTREADKRRVFVIRADGTVISKQSKGAYFHENFENLRLHPGDAVVVPEKLRTPGSKGILEFTQGISQSALTAAALSSVLP